MAILGTSYYSIIPILEQLAVFQWLATNRAAKSDRWLLRSHSDSESKESPTEKILIELGALLMTAVTEAVSPGEKSLWHFSSAKSGPKIGLVRKS